MGDERMEEASRVQGDEAGPAAVQWKGKAVKADTRRCKSDTRLVTNQRLVDSCGCTGTGNAFFDGIGPTERRRHEAIKSCLLWK